MLKLSHDIARIGAVMPAVRNLTVAFGVFACLAASDVTATTRTKRRISVHWDRVPIGDAIARVDEQFDESVFVDRRIDPRRRISLTSHGATCGEMLAQIADAAALGVSHVVDLWYIGPPQIVEQLRTLVELRRQDVLQLPKDTQRALVSSTGMAWPRLTEPRELVHQRMAEQGFAVGGLESIPHDLWDAGRLPAMPLADQLTVILAGFDLTYRPLANHRAIEIVPINGPVTLLRQYPWRDRSASQLRSLQQRVPSAEIRVERQSLLVRGRWEDHEQIAQWLESSSRPQASEPRGRHTAQRYTLRVQDQPVIVLLDQLSRQLQWKVEIDRSALEAAGVSLDQRVTFSVDDADSEQLIEVILRPLGVGFQFDGRTLRIEPASESGHSRESRSNQP